MYKVILSSEDLDAKQQKNRDYNMNQTVVGSPLKTLKGSVIKRSNKYEVGKVIGGQIYLHKNYADIVIPFDILNSAVDLLESSYSQFHYNCIRYDPKSTEVLFQESPDFDTAREPVVGTCVSVIDNQIRKTRYFNQIWHHKWLWVDNSYTGFDVEESWSWSKEWLSVLTEPANGSNQQNWMNQLNRFGLE